MVNHLVFLGTYPGDRRDHRFYAFREREPLQAVLEEASGGRIHYMANRVGGLKEDVPAGWTDRVRAASARSAGGCPTGPADRGTRRRARRRRGVLSPADAKAYGVSGPVARASGLDVDLRRDEPYLAYGRAAGAGW